ncbi:MAG: hypothetical protein JXJ04_11135 [Spirochaetales bacterium]|nr:hypothetical protein [Spirochaetales bacterium]
MNLFKTQKSLTEKVLEYQQTGKGYNELLKALCLKIYTYPKNKYGLTEEDYSKFYIFFLPQLKKITQSFNNSGNTFETYFNSVLYWKLKTYVKNKIRRYYMWETSESDSLWTPVYDGDPVRNILIKIVNNNALADVFMINERGMIHNEGGKKQLLLFMLRKVKDMDIEDIIQLSRITGYEVEWLRSITESLKDSLEHKFNRLKRFRERRNLAFWRLKLLEKQLKNEVDEKKKRRIKEDCERAKYTMKQAIKIMSKVRLSPTHDDLANVMCLPKGTIDSCFRRLKKKLTGVYNDKKKIYA